MKTSRLTLAAIGLCVAGAWPMGAQGPSFDSSGNGLLNGNYYFRHVFYILQDDDGDLNRAISVYGNIAFNGSGTYTISNAQVMDSSVGEPDALSCWLAGTECTTSATTVSGTYTLAASGFGYFSNPLSSGDLVYMTVGNSGSTTAGLITGSSTESGFNDLFLAAEIVSPGPSVGTFNGTWTMAGYLPGATPAGAANVFFQMAPNGAGSLGTVQASGYIGGSGTTVETQTIGSVKYIFSSGAAVLEFPTSTSSTAYYFTGNEYLYFSPDNNFAFGGSPYGYDMLVAVRNDPSGTVENFSSLYFQSAVNTDLSTYASTGAADFNTNYGSLSAGGGNIVGSQRVNDLITSSSAYSYTYADTYPVPIVGSGEVTDSTTQTQIAYGDGGTIQIGAGIWPYLGMTVAFKALPSTTATSSVYIYPSGIVNAASSAPFTAFVSNGELLTLYGTNLAASLVTAPGIPFPTTLGGVQVLINGQAAPIYYVSPGQVSVIVPYENPFTVVTFQVYNNNVPSNVVTEFAGKTSAGLFTVPPGGLGYGALLHNATGQLVTSLNPAQPGEYVQAFVTGLGDVYPTIVDGAAGPTTPSLAYSDYFSTTASENQITAYVGGVSAPVVYAGLAPGLAGLYQINLQIPTTGLTAGDNDIDISGPDSYSSEALISIGSSTGTALSTGEGSAEAIPSVVRRKKATDPAKKHQLRNGAGLFGHVISK